MRMSILNMKPCPADPIERIVWLDSVKAAVADELDAAYETAYFEARMRGHFDAALEIGRTSRKKALAWTRRHNEKMGRQVRWGDGQDPSSTAYSG